MKTNLSFEKLLLAFFAFIFSLITLRIFYSGSLLFIFLVWNIFLAWIPFRLSLYLVDNNSIQQWKAWLLFAAWLLFFPNALYIITDLVHLEIDSSIPKWFDAILLFSSSIVGLMMAFVSLFRVEKFLAKRVSEKRMPVLIIGILFVSSFGVYLGRFLRWNSWDIIRHPLGLFSTIIERVIFPFEHMRTWGITLLLTTLFYLLYLVIKKMPGHLTGPTDS